MSVSDFSLRGQCRGTCALLWGAVAQVKPGDMQREGPSLGRTRVVAASPLSPSGSTSVGNAGRRPDLSLQRRNACAQLAHPVRVPTRVIHPVITYVPVRPRRERWPRRPPMEVSAYAPPRAQGHLGDDARRRHDPSTAPWCVRRDPPGVRWRLQVRIIPRWGSWEALASPGHAKPRTRGLPSVSLYAQRRHQRTVGTPWRHGEQPSSPRRRWSFLVHRCYMSWNACQPCKVYRSFVHGIACVDICEEPSTA